MEQQEDYTVEDSGISPLVAGLATFAVVIVIAGISAFIGHSGVVTILVILFFGLLVSLIVARLYGSKKNH